MLTGLNHLTLAVQDLQRSIDFYRALLHFKLDARWDAGAYLHVGNLWLCLTLDTASRGQVAAGHQLEAHVGSLASRLAECRVKPYKGMVVLD